MVWSSEFGQKNERYVLYTLLYSDQYLTNSPEGFVGEFSMVHGHYMQMGGFMLYSLQGTRLDVITDPKELSRAIHVGGSILPTVEEIIDKSKGDSLSKALAVGQTGWFIAQRVSRLAASLTISQMEVITVALAALNGVIYFLWWNKPLNVRYPVRIIFGHRSNKPSLSIAY